MVKRDNVRLLGTILKGIWRIPMYMVDDFNSVREKIPNMIYKCENREELIERLASLLEDDPEKIVIRKIVTVKPQFGSHLVKESNDV